MGREVKEAIAWRDWNGLTFYVESLKGRVGDWGYTTNAEKALPLNSYWQKRFAKDCRDVGAEARFIEVMNYEGDSNGNQA